MNLMIQNYGEGIFSARSAVTASDEMRCLLDPRASNDLVIRFWIEFCSRAVHITEPVEGWIRRAGERCELLGLKDLGRQLKAHAKHEAGHHLLLIEDTHRLVARWNRTHIERLDAEQLLARPKTGPMHAYIQLHEQVIASDRPYLQVAIEREIEGLSTAIGPPMVEQCRRVLGEQGMGDVHFLTEHVEIDVGHTILNEKLLTSLLSANAGAMVPAVAVGTTVLRIYAAFLGDCVRAAMNHTATPVRVNAPAMP